MTPKKISSSERIAIIADLFNLDLGVEAIVTKYGVSPNVIYAVAARVGLDMSLRSRILKMKAQKKFLEDKILASEKVFRTP